MTEKELQGAAMEYIQRACPKLYPYTLHPKNEGTRIWNKKIMGNSKGIPDILILLKNENYSGVAIELKAGKNKATPEQLAWLERLFECGFVVGIAKTVESVKNIISKYEGKK